MRFMKQTALLFLIIVMGVVAAACGNSEKPAATQKSGQDQQQTQPAPEKKKYKVVMHAEFPPFEYLDPTGKPVGYEVDLINALGKELGWDIEIKNTSWDGVFEEIESKKAQIAISGITIRPDRQKKYLFSKPYFVAKQLLLVPDNSPIKGIKDIKGKRVGVMTSTTGSLIAQDMLGKTSPNIRSYAEMPSMVEDLYNKRVDVVIADNAYLLAQLAKDPKEGYRIIDDPTIPKEDYGIMVNLKDTELMKQIDDTMQKLRDNGVYDELYKKYFPDKK